MVLCETKILVGRLLAIYLVVTLNLATSWPICYCNTQKLSLQHMYVLWLLSYHSSAKELHQYQFTFKDYVGVPEIHMDYGGLPQLHWQGLVSWEVRREQIAQARARNPTNLKSKSPPNLKSKNLNLIYKNLSKGPIIEKGGKLQDRSRKTAWRIQTPKWIPEKSNFDCLAQQQVSFLYHQSII